MLQTARTVTDADDGCLRGSYVLICDRDTKWSATVRQTLAAAGVRVIQTPYRAPNCNAYAERFVRSIKEECLDRIVFLGEPTCGGRSRHSPSITTANGITKAYTID